MSAPIPRLRMFAGPNGSGKSTLKPVLRTELLGVYLNADDVEQEIRRQSFLDFNAYGVTTTAEEVLRFFKESDFLKSTEFAAAVERLVLVDDRLSFAGVAVNSYLASVAVDYLRQKLLERKVSFTFETVMSHPSKVALLERAQALGYRTYLYYIATDDPEINISRVRYRVEKQGGHAVPEEKIISRYHRSLGLLMKAIGHTNRAYIFDNSGHQQRTWLAEITDGRVLEMKTDRIPAWFQRAVLDKAPGKHE